MIKIPEPFKHQVETTEFMLNNPRIYNTSDPGTGKTRTVLDFFNTILHQARSMGLKRPKMLVVAPLSILQSSWGDDIDKFTPSIRYAVAYAKNRIDVLNNLDKYDIVMVNHDGINAFANVANIDKLSAFTHLCIDEITAYKNYNAKRSKSMTKVADRFQNIIGMTGTPIPNTVLDVWNQMRIIDRGQRLGTRFTVFRCNVCDSHYNGFANVWTDKPKASDLVASQLSDINIRYMLEECIDMPEHNERTMLVDLPVRAMKAYNQMRDESVVELDDGEVSAVNAGARVRKLLQICTGAVYDTAKNILQVHKNRYDLVLDLVGERPHSLVAFNYKHERDYLIEQADNRNYSFAVIDGETNAKERTQIVRDFQFGKYKVLFAHPQSTSHGLTLTKAVATIWCGPTYSSESYTQFNRRIYRAGQTKKTETIRIAARGTWEEKVFEKLGNKISSMNELLQTLKEIR